MTGVPVGRDDTTAEFFDGTAVGKFLIRRCQPHGHASRPQARQCSTCGSTELRWDEASGAARLISWAVLPGDPSRVVAVGQLAEGPWWWTKLTAPDPGALTAGVALRLAYEQEEGSETVPYFELA
jgi:hypothetical protein